MTINDQIIRKNKERQDTALCVSFVVSSYELFDRPQIFVVYCHDLSQRELALSAP